ncbi:MAG: YraN family protein [Oscillospiraceae bacterium]|nr:YraN family protein [Oscillospiraceae bacterium]MBQ8732793.1 YraN family protein [Oscillospiraceae bacterium]
MAGADTEANKKRGYAGEELAARYLARKGYQILDRNFHSRFGEIDIIAQWEEFIVFAEVKLRTEGYLCSPAEAVDRKKRLRLTQTAWVYLLENPTQLQPRFDLVEIIRPAKEEGKLLLRHTEGAFDAEPMENIPL